MTISKIISGGQTGVDRAALDVAISHSIDHGGWCPRGRRSEDGPIPDHYRLQETPDSDYLQRTQWNVRDSDATLILFLGELEGGTQLTRDFARQLHKPYQAINLQDPLPVTRLKAWLEDEKIGVLNVAGPRASKQPVIYEQALAYLTRLLEQD